jgi:dihydrodipicolinate synthase/N-acetylneuraminate lyase
MDAAILQALRHGVVIPACPLALTARRCLDERSQRALCRYYAAAGAGGIAVGVHTTQFAIRDPQIGLYEPVLTLMAEEMDRQDPHGSQCLVRVAGVCGTTAQAVSEAEVARGLGYQVALVSLAALWGASEHALVEHCRAVGRVLPLFGFYVQPAVGGRVLPVGFWRRFLELDAVVAIKIAPFNRYQTLDVLRAVAETGRLDVALYTGNDDHIVLDLVTPHRLLDGQGRAVELRIVGGLLGQWAVWTKRAVELLEECRAVATSGGPIPQGLLTRAVELTDANAALFDAANGFRGCIAGIHEVLRRQGLLAGTWLLDPEEGLSPCQVEEIDRVVRDYPHLTDDGFVAHHRDRWLRD